MMFTVGISNLEWINRNGFLITFALKKPENVEGRRKIQQAEAAKLLHHHSVQHISGAADDWVAGHDNTTRPQTL